MYRRGFEFGSAVDCSLDDVVYRLDYILDLENARLNLPRNSQRQLD
jgi:hypothetical protein